MAAPDARDLPAMACIGHIRVALVVRGQTHRCRGSGQAQRALHACMCTPGRAGQRAYIRQCVDRCDMRARAPPYTHTAAVHDAHGHVCLRTTQCSMRVSHHITAPPDMQQPGPAVPLCHHARRCSAWTVDREATVPPARRARPATEWCLLGRAPHSSPCVYVGPAACCCLLLPCPGSPQHMAHPAWRPVHGHGQGRGRSVLRC